MRVPTRYTTQVQPSSQARAKPQVQIEPGAFGMDVSRAIQGIGQTLAQVGTQLREDEARLRDFERQRLLSTERVDLTLDMQARTTAAPLGAAGFTDSVATDYEARHQQMLDTYRQSGATEEEVQEFELSLLQMRGNAIIQAAEFQQRSRTAQAAVEVNDVGLRLAQLADASPYELDEAIAEWNAVIDSLPGVDAITRESLREQYITSITEAAGYGLARLDPQTVIDALSTTEPTDVVPGQAVANVVSAGSGYTEVQYADGTVERRTGSRAWRNNNPGNIEYGSFARAHGAVGSDGRFAVFPSYEAGRAAKEALLFDSANYRNLTISEAINRYAPPSDNNNTQAYIASVTRAIGVDASTPLAALSQEQRAMMLDAMEQVEGFRPGSASATRGLNAEGKTGNPVLDALSPAQRQRVLSEAQTTYNRQQAAVRGDLEARVANAEAAYLQTGTYEGREPTMAEFFAAYDPTEALQKWAAFDNTRQVGQFIQEMVTLPPEQIFAMVSDMMPTDTASPTYAADLVRYERAQEAAANIMQQRIANPAAYVSTHFPAVAAAWDAVQDAPNPEFARMEAYYAMAEAYRQLGFSQSQMQPIPTDRVPRMIEELTSMMPEQQVQYLAGLRREMGSLFSNGIQQLAEGGAPLQAYLAGLVAESPQHMGVAANVLRGMQVIAADPTRRPSEEAAQSSFRLAMGQSQLMLDPQASGAIYEAAKALYVFRGGPEAAGDFDDNLFRESVREVLGGLPGQEDTGPVDMQRRNFFGFSSVPEATILPPGVSRSQFEDWMDSLTPDDLISYGLGGRPPVFDDGELTPVTPQDIAEEGVFVKVAPGQYIIKMISDGLPLVTEDGSYYVMGISPNMILQRPNTQIVVTPNG